LTFAITWGIGALLMLYPGQLTDFFGPMSMQNPVFVIAVWAPAISALVMTTRTEGVTGLHRLVCRVTHWRVGLRWYLFVLLGIPIIGLAAARLGGVTHRFDLRHAYLIIPGLLNAVLTDPGPLGEEPGWRGYALPHLQKERTALSASIILGLIWGVWHVPAFLIGGTPQHGLSLPALLLGGVALSILATWLYNNTRGSVMLTILLHLMANFCLNVIGAPLVQLSGLLAITALIVVLAAGPQHLSRTRA
jgi:membrane protease YdiL (CAAX protease family)